MAVMVWAKTNPPVRPMRTVTLGVPTADRGEGPQAPILQVQGRR
jgi:hypothetical protein